MILYRWKAVHNRMYLLPQSACLSRLPGFLVIGHIQLRRSCARHHGMAPCVLWRLSMTAKKFTSYRTVSRLLIRNRPFCGQETVLFRCSPHGIAKVSVEVRRVIKAAVSLRLILWFIMSNPRHVASIASSCAQRASRAWVSTVTTWRTSSRAMEGKSGSVRISSAAASATGQSPGPVPKRSW